MPNWSNTLPPTGRHHGYDLRRTPAAGALQAICTCPNIVVCDTHFWGGRTIPCEREVNADGKTVDDTNCPACVAKQGYRTHVYVSAFDCKTRDHFLFECTTNAAKAFVEFRDGNGTLRGCVMHAHRPKGGANSKVVIQTNTTNLAKIILPNPPDIPKALAIIWRLPTNATNETPDGNGIERTRVRSEILNAMRTQPTNAGSKPDPPAVGELMTELTKTNLKNSNGKSK